MGIYDGLLRVYRNLRLVHMNLRLVHMNLRLVHMNLRLVHMNALCFSSIVLGGGGYNVHDINHISSI